MDGRPCPSRWTRTSLPTGDYRDRPPPASTSAAVDLRPGQHESAQSSDTVHKAKSTRGYRLAAVAGIGLAILLGVAILYSPAKQTIALYKRSAAAVQACEAAGAEIARLRRATLFMDDCSTPVVTPLFGSEGQVIVTRTVAGARRSL